jgi:Glycosyltransferase family 87
MVAAMVGLRSRPLWFLIGVGLVIRVVLAFAFRGTNHVVIEEIAASGVRNWDWHSVYEGGPFIEWTYPPLFLGWLAGASWLSDVSGLSFHGLAKLGPTLADVGLALGIYIYLGWRGARERLRLAGTALVMLGPSFIAISGYHGQIDSVAILPAAVGVMVWERSSGPHRALWAGLLIGVGAAVKAPPLLLLVPLLASARSRREVAELAGGALAVLLITLGPLWASGIDLSTVVKYSGVPGWGGLSLVIDPAVGWHVLTMGVSPPRPAYGGLELTVQDNARWITLVALAAYAGFVFHYRPAAIDAAALLWLVIYAFSPNFFLNYLVWGLPFFIMAGFLIEVAVLQALLIAPTLGYYIALWPNPSTATGVLYVPALIALWGFWVFATAAVTWRIVKQHEKNFARVQPPLVNLS